MGALVGPGVDENKVVELADGTVLMNARAKPYRLLAQSKDGGLTYGALRADTQLVDPGNNAAIVRIGAAGTRDLLLFSNTADVAERRRLTLRLSCDGGRTWSMSRVLVEGPSAYSSLAILPSGDVGVLFERGEYEAISFARVPVSWVGRCP